MRIKYLLVTLAVLVMPGLVFAQTATTSTSSVAALIEQLRAQIQNLQTQIANLQQAKNTVQQAKGEIKDSLDLVRQLRPGMSGDDVKALQALLSSMEGIYPEGLITGYYGQATTRAVKRYQEKYGLPQVGNVGPLTLQKVKKSLEDTPLLLESSSSTGEVKVCVPPGHLIAKGWIKKHGQIDVQTVSVCSGAIPQGILNKLIARGATTSTTSVPLVVSDAVARSITETSAIISWATNKPSTSQVEYGTSSAYGMSTASDSAMVYVHSQTLTGLSSSTTYHFKVVSKDSSGNVAQSADASFMTLPVPDTTAPSITGVNASDIASTSAKVNWVTNELSKGKVYYSTTSGFAITSGALVSETSFATSHSLFLTGLNATTTYYYVVQAADSVNNSATSSQYQFKTLE